MPKELTHWIVAQRALERLSSESRLKRIIDSHYPIYLAGAVLPDTLLYLHKGKHAATARTLAGDFHNTTDNSFAPLIIAEERFQGRLPEPLLACLLGVISHIVADMTFHPFVYAHTGTTDIGLHYQLETDLDVYFIQTGSASPALQMVDLILPATRATLVTACSLLFDPHSSLPAQALHLALNEHCRIQAMYDSNFWKMAALLLSMFFGAGHSQRLRLFYPIRRPRKQLEALSNPGTWQHPATGETMHDTPHDLAERTVQRTVMLLEHIASRGSIGETLSEFRGGNLVTGQ
jgi:hypothetical protein